MLKKSNQKGFSIIEVLIVLAIAGLIMLIVFLAVPALQRNSRNTAREADASKILAAVNQCLSNRNGATGQCNSNALLTANGGLEMTSLNQIQTITLNRANVGNGLFNDLNYSFTAQCANDTADIAASTNSRSYAVAFRIENGTANGITKCIQG
ncbi:MAG: hypothetical protein QG562_419 [Patescibacteria group bacterium]|nr:hypothetical protein [Patescibacteria group bacterium]MDQ5958600.1 hypothetical protein [Patescibacteria group bacterium]